MSRRRASPNSESIEVFIGSRGTHWTASLNHTRTGCVRAEYTYVFGDQLWLADAGSWQIADLYTMAS
eukprot:scaffold17758_cov64-Phaeocystis_antarctica.AAC.1